MTNEQIKYMVDRFLGWRLPENFNPDGGISFKKAINADRPSWPQNNEPVGTNLLDATQAEEMVRYMVEGIPVAESAAIPPALPHNFENTVQPALNALSLESLRDMQVHIADRIKELVQDHGPRVDTRSDLGLERCPKCGSDERSMLCMECFRNERDPHPWHHS